MNADECLPSKKKTEKVSTDNVNVSTDKVDAKKEDPKPRIVLTFRSEKTSAKSSNMKIVSTEEKTEDAPRRSSRTRVGKWEWICDSDTSPKKDKSGAQTTSENDESDSSHTNTKRSTRRRSKDTDNILANAIARKEKSYETQAPPQRLSRRIKPTAKILANEELRIGLESQNNARLGLQSDKSPEEGVRTRRSGRSAVREEKKVAPAAIEDEVVEIGTTDDDSQGQPQDNSVMKLKHLCELGLKAISPEENEESGNETRVKEENEVDEIEEDDEIDDDPNVISKLLETDEDSDEDYQCSVDVKKKRPVIRRSTRLASTFGGNESDRSSPTSDDDEKLQRRKRRRVRSSGAEEAHSDVEMEEVASNPAGGDEGSEAACPVDETTVIATCFCQSPSNIYADPEELTEPVFCQAVEMVDSIAVGCSHVARRRRSELAAMRRAGPRAPYLLLCALHSAQMDAHMCCPACGLFCTQGTFYQCSSGHLFHLDCGLPYNDVKASRPGCPHCGVFSYRWQPANTECVKVKVEMKCSNKRIFLPDQREQCTPSYLTFAAKEYKMEQGPVIPQDLLPSPPIELKQLMQATGKSPSQLSEAILNGDPVDQLLPKLVSSSYINKRVGRGGGGTCAHVAARRGHVCALYLLHYAGANLDATDANMKTPLMAAIEALVEKPEIKTKEKVKEITENVDIKDIKVEPESEKESTSVVVKTEKEDDKSEIETSDDKDVPIDKPKDEDLIKVIRYLLAAGCDVNFPGPEGLTALHLCAQRGGAAVASLLLGDTRTNVDQKDQGGWTPLVWAAENDHIDVVKVLLSGGADCSATDAEGNGAAHWCALGGVSAALRLLLEHAPHLAHLGNAHHDTPLHIAARQGHYACVVILLARGARTDVENSAGELPVEVCTAECQSAISLNMQMSIALKDKLSRYKLLSSDISNGREPYPIPCVNEVDDETLPDDFTYVTRHVMPHTITVDNTIDTMQGCECKDGDCSSGDCGCCALGVRSWYTRGRLQANFPYHDPPMLFECNETCGCNLRRCNNSVVTKASQSASMLVRASVFRAGGARGWALRARQCVPRGACAATYCGELLDVARADTRPADHYMFALDVKPDLKEQCGDKSQLCVDAAVYGSAARFINHSCRPNLAPVRVFTTTRDLRLPTIALFATRDIEPDEEFTFDYGDKFWCVKSKWMKCECGHVECRYPVKSTEENEST